MTSDTNRVGLITAYLLHVHWYSYFLDGQYYSEGAMWQRGAFLLMRSASSAAAGDGDAEDAEDGMEEGEQRASAATDDATHLPSHASARARAWATGVDRRATARIEWLSWAMSDMPQAACARRERQARDVEERLAQEFMRQHTAQEGGHAQCGLCAKCFTGPEFLPKHLTQRHVFSLRKLQLKVRFLPPLACSVRGLTLLRAPLRSQELRELMREEYNGDPAHPTLRIVMARDSRPPRATAEPHRRESWGGRTRSPLAARVGAHTDVVYLDRDAPPKVEEQSARTLVDYGDF